MTQRKWSRALPVAILVLAGLLTVHAFRLKPPVRSGTVKIEHNEASQRVDVTIDGKPFTSYIYPNTIKKPVLFPIRTASGTVITRGFPLEPRPGERVDHPHHVGLWFNYGDVNGLDFWNNSDSIPAEKRDGYGTIVHRKVNKTSNGNTGVLDVTMDWLQPDSQPILREDTRYTFSGDENIRTIERTTTLTALDGEVLFADNKEGMFALRVARQLEQPSNKPDIYTDASGQVTDVPQLNNDGVTGLYRSSEGKVGDAVWGTRAKWVNLTGEIDGEQISLVIMDHPSNVGHPAYWHARGYGLYAANNLGQKAMSGGKEELNFKLSPGRSVTFKHRIVIYSGDAVAEPEINSAYQKFSR